MPGIISRKKESVQRIIIVIEGLVKIEPLVLLFLPSPEG
jgi:hypothetical protein